MLEIACMTLASVAAMDDPVPYHILVSADAPVLWYKCNEPSGLVINHGSLGDPYDAEPRNGVTRDVPTASGDTGVLFDAHLAQFLESLAPSPDDLSGNPTFTTEAVVFVTGGPNLFYSPFLHWGAPNTGQSVYFSLWRQTSDRGYAGFYNGGLRTTCFGTPNGRWLHVMWIRESASGTNDEYTGTTLYVNGIPQQLEIDDTLPGCGVPQVTSTTFRVGTATDFNRHFSGIVDEIVLYDRALTEADVQARVAALGFVPFDCKADFNNDCLVNTQDVLAFLNAWSIGDNNADFNSDDTVNTQDVLAFLNAWSAGC